MTAPAHTPRRDAYGVLICDTCTVAENRFVAGHPVWMYWGQGDCPGQASTQELDALPRVARPRHDPEPDTKITFDPRSEASRRRVYSEALAALCELGVPEYLVRELLDKAVAVGRAMQAEHEAEPPAAVDCPGCGSSDTRCVQTTTEVSLWGCETCFETWAVPL